MNVRINTDNAAFRPDPTFEIARILRELADRIEWGEEDGKLTDVNGNVVGHFQIRSSAR